MTKTDLVSRAQDIVESLNGLDFNSAIIVMSAVAESISGNQGREASIAKTKFEEGILWARRAAEIKQIQNAVEHEEAEKQAAKILDEKPPAPKKARTTKKA